MTRHLLARLARMDRREVAWRTQAAARIGGDRLRTAVTRPRWDRRDLLARLARTPALDGVRASLRSRHWDAAHTALSAHFAARPARFVIAPSLISSVRHRVRSTFPDSARGAVARADRLLQGDFDLLAYRGLRFGQGALLTGASWRRDPVHDRQAPQTFWADVPYLDPACGDHKIIWELNRHQHWLPLGRAYWLTGDRRYRDRCLAELASWLDANPPLIGVNWASMLELAFRSLSWIWALHFFVDDRPGTQPGQLDAAPWTVDLLLGIDRQLEHVEHNLSYYFSPNTHLLGEALALYVGGRALPELARSGRWERIGRQVLVAEMDRQITGDGGHSERSTHYHRYALDFYLLALAVARITHDPVGPAFERAVGQLAGAARLLADDGGRVAHIGDDDGGTLMPIAGRAADDWRDSLAAAAALLDRPGLCIGSAPEET
ncbi:MAG TPA: heparinase II/III family protein, partial [Vicinamibacterales bacterium]|nr:heparinase II/III family protein [Vicinamibacterales bacterium]